MSAGVHKPSFKIRVTWACLVCPQVPHSAHSTKHSVHSSVGKCVPSLSPSIPPIQLCKHVPTPAYPIRNQGPHTCRAAAHADSASLAAATSDASPSRCTRCDWGIGSRRTRFEDKTLVQQHWKDMQSGKMCCFSWLCMALCCIRQRLHNRPTLGPCKLCAASQSVP